MSILYITAFYPCEKESFRGHFIEKQAKQLAFLLNEEIIVIKPNFSARSLKRTLGCKIFNNTKVCTINYPNFFKQLSLHSTAQYSAKFFKDDIDALLSSNKPKLIISNDTGASLTLGNILQINYQCKHFCIVHGEDTSRLGRTALLNNLVKCELEKCDKIFAVSGKIKDYLIKKFSYKRNITVNANGISADVVLAYTNFNFKKNDVLTITSIGNLQYGKGFDIVIEALKDLRINYKYFIIGDGSYKRDLIALINKYQLADRIFFTGNIENAEVFKYLERSHFFILPSRNEAFGIVYLEAMITENICVGTKGQGCEDFIIDQENGFLVTEASQITDIIAEHHILLCQGIIQRKASRTARNYTWERNATVIRDAYYNL